MHTSVPSKKGYLSLAYADEKAEGINRMIFRSRLKFKWLVSIVLKLLMFSRRLDKRDFIAFTHFLIIFASSDRK